MIGPNDRPFGVVLAQPSGDAAAKLPSVEPRYQCKPMCHRNRQRPQNPDVPPHLADGHQCVPGTTYDASDIPAIEVWTPEANRLDVQHGTAARGELHGDVLLVGPIGPVPVGGGEQNHMLTELWHHARARMSTIRPA